MDLQQLLAGLGTNAFNPSTASASKPNIQANMAPPSNFWEGNEFKMGVPGLQAKPAPTHTQGPAPTPDATPPSPSPVPSNPLNDANTGRWTSYLQANPDVMNAWNTNSHGIQSMFGSPEQYAEQFHYPRYGRDEGRSFGQTPAPAAPPPNFGGAPNPVPGAGPGNSQPSNGQYPMMGNNPFLQNMGGLYA